MNCSHLIARAAFGLVFVVALCGCASRSQLARLASEKEQLVAAIESEKKLNTDLAARLQSASERAAEAERTLAQLDGGIPGRSSANLVNTPARSSSPSSSSSSLEQWARSQPLLKYDARRRLAQVDIDLAFDENDRLTMDARRGLDQVADLLASSSAARYGIAVGGIQNEAGQSDRASKRSQAVVDWLHKRGIAEDRVSASVRAGTSLIDEEGRKLPAPRLVALEIVELPGRSDAVANDPKADGGWTTSGRR